MAAPDLNNTTKSILTGNSPNTPPTSGGQMRILPFKRIIFPAQANTETLEAIDQLFHSIGSKLDSIRIPESILLRLGQIGKKVEPGTYNIAHDARDGSSVRRQEAEFFLDDIAFLIFQTRAWLISHQLGVKANYSLFDDGEFAIIDEVGEKARPSLVPQSRLIDRRKDIATAIQKLITVIGISETPTAQDVGEYDSLQPFIALMSGQNSYKLSKSVWQIQLLPLAIAFSKTEPQVITFSAQIPTLLPLHNKALVAEARLVFHWFLKSLKEAIEDTNKLPRENKNHGKPAYTFLETEEEAFIENIESNTELFFPDTEDVSELISDSKKFSPVTDGGRIKKFLEFLLNQGVMDRILGDKELDPEIVAAQSAVEEEGDGETTLEEPEELKIGQVIKLEDLAARNRQKLIKLIVEHDDLNFGEILKNYSFSAAELAEARRFVIQIIDDLVPPESVWVEILKQAPYADYLNLEESSFKLTVKLISIIDADISSQVEEQIIKIASKHGSAIKFVQNTLDEFQRSKTLQNEVEKLANNQIAFANASTPENLDEIISRYQAFLTAAADKEKSPLELWQSLSIRERRNLLNLSPKHLKIYSASAYFLALQQLQIQGLSLTQAQQVLTENPDLQEKFLDFILGLDYDQLIKLQTGLGREQLFPQLALTIQNSSLAALIQTYAETYLSLESANVKNVNKRAREFKRATESWNVAVGREPETVKTPTEKLPTTPEIEDLAVGQERERLKLINRVWWQLPLETQIEIYIEAGLQIPNLERITNLDLPLNQLSSTSLIAFINSTDLGREALHKESITETSIVIPPEPIKPQSSAKTQEQEPSSTTDKYIYAKPGIKKPNRVEQLKKKIQNPIKKATENWNKLQALSIGSQFLAVGAAILKALTSWGALLGGITGYAIGGPFAPFTALGGSFIGDYIGGKIGFNNLWGLGRPYEILGKLSGRAISTVFPTGLAQSAPIAAGVPPLTPSYATSILEKSAPLLQNHWVLGGLASGGIGLSAIIVFVGTYTAFLQPLPTIDQGGQESLYLEINKTVAGGESFATPADITYSISLVPKTNPKDGRPYKIEILSTPTDDFSLLVNKEKNPDSSNPDLPASESYEAFKAGLPSKVGLQIESKTEMGSYTLAFGSNNEPKNGEGIGPYDHLGVGNIFSVNFNVYDADGNPVAKDQLATGSRSICFGECPISSEGCFVFGEAGKFFPFSGGGVTSQEWIQKDKDRVAAGFKRAGQSQMYTSLLCSGGPITLYRFPTSADGYGGWALSTNAVGLYGVAFDSGDLGMEYTLVHESGHIIDFRNGNGGENSIRWKYENENSYNGCFTYPFKNNGVCPTGEAFAEGIALSVVYKDYNFETVVKGKYNFPEKNPVEYNWFKTYIFGGIEF